MLCFDMRSMARVSLFVYLSDLLFSSSYSTGVYSESPTPISKFFNFGRIFYISTQVIRLDTIEMFRFTLSLLST